MKIYLGLNAIVFVSLNLIAWPVCWAAPPEPGDYRVYDATGGHMQKDDEFTISEETADEKKVYKIKPSVKLKKDWHAADDTFEMISVKISGDTVLCGFVDIDSSEHTGNKYGHDKTHGFLMRAMPPDPETGNERVEIIWSALPLKNKTPENCNNLKKRFHGGMAHATR